MGTVSGGHDQDTAAAGGGQRSSGELSQGPRGSHTHVDMSDTSWFILCVPGHLSAWGRELGHSWSPPPPHPRGKAATSPLVPLLLSGRVHSHTKACAAGLTGKFPSLLEKLSGSSWLGLRPSRKQLPSSLQPPPSEGERVGGPACASTQPCLGSATCPSPDFHLSSARSHCYPCRALN